MANVEYDGLNQEELRIVNDALQTPPDNWANIAGQIYQDLQQHKIGRFESSPLQVVAKLDRIIAGNIDPGSPNRLYPQFHLEGDGSITFIAQQHERSLKQQN